MRRRSSLLTLVVIASLAPSWAGAAVWRVPEDQPTVAQALAGSASGDTVLLAPGAYAESVVLPAGITLRGADPAQPPVIDAGGAGPVITSVQGTGASRLEVLVLRGGGGTTGGAVRVQGGALSLRDVRVEDCTATFGGALALINDASVSWSGGSVTGCAATYGGAVFANRGSLALSALTLSSNAAQQGGAVYAQDATPVSLVSCTFENNQSSADGGALALLRCGVSLSDCRLRGNRATGNGGGMDVGPGTHAVCGYTVFYGNQATLGGGVYAHCDGPAGAACALVELVHADLVRNVAGASGAAGAGGAARLSAEACVVAFNTGALACLDPRATLDVGCTLLHANGLAPGPEDCAHSFADTTSADPLLCDVNGGVLERCADSPALLPAACGLPFLGALGAGCPECPTTAAVPTTWGGLKARYR